MSQPLVVSETPLVFDTIPVLKVRYFTAGYSRKLYCYARLYALGNSLAVNLCCFEREPAPGSSVAFAVAGTKGILVCVLTPDALVYSVAQPGGALQAMAQKAAPLPVPERFGGVDEQGWYWGANLALEPPLLQAAGIDILKPFGAAVYQFVSGEPGCGASHAGEPLQTALFTQYIPPHTL